MKKNITINLFGTLYNIDEDAYQLLDNYLNSMKRYFGNQDNNSEVADDIENRVAELLWEKKEQGMEAVNLDVIKEIIGKIGNAEEIAGYDNERENRNGDGHNGGCRGLAGDSCDAPDAPDATMWQRIRKHFRYRHLYRDPENNILGGVCSGIAHYIGFGDPVLWRLLLLLLIFFQGTGLLAYIVLWIIVPMAYTPEDKLRMRGIRVTPDNLNRQIIQEHSNDTAQTRMADGRHQSCATGCLKLLFGIFVIVPIAMTLLFVLTMVPALLGIVKGVSGCMSCMSDFPWLHHVEHNGTFVATGIICTVVMLLLILFFLTRRLFGSGKPMNRKAVMALVATLITCLIVSIYCFSTVAARMYSLAKGRDRLNYTINITNGKDIEIKCLNQTQPNKDMPYLEQTGFGIVQNNTTRCTWSGDYPTGDRARRYLDANDSKSLLFTAEKTDTIDPGIYTLSALVRAQQDGACLYIKTGNAEILKDIPATGNHHGNLWEWACGKSKQPDIEKFYPDLATDLARQAIAAANSGSGFGWNVISIPNIKVNKRQAISYGISTDPAITKRHHMFSWVSATDFVLTQTDKRRADANRQKIKSQPTKADTIRKK